MSEHEQKICRKGLHKYPSHLKRCPECKRAKDGRYKATPKGKAATKRYRSSPKGKSTKNAASKRYNGTPKGKEAQQKRWKRWYQTSEGRAKDRAKRKRNEQMPHRKASRRAYRLSPKGREVSRVAAHKRTVIAAQGDLTTEQWLGRLAEFDHKCAYCDIHLLTKDDDVNRWHPQYLNLEHIIPLLPRDGEKQGEHTLANVVPACYSCNANKDNKDVWQWLQEQNRTPSPKLLAILHNLFPSRI